MYVRKQIKILYKNYKGETAIREIIPIQMIFDSSEYHKDKQWLLKAFALDKKEERTFALKEIQEWYFD